MNGFKKILLFVIAPPLIAAGLSGCCYKKDCFIELQEEISFRLTSNGATNSFTREELDSMVMVLYDPATEARIDSMPLVRQQSFFSVSSSGNDIFSFNEIQLNRAQKTAKGMNIILKIPSGSFEDTLFNINFNHDVFEYVCNVCLFSNSTDKQPFIKDRSLTFRGKFLTIASFR